MVAKSVDSRFLQQRIYHSATSSHLAGSSLSVRDEGMSAARRQKNILGWMDCGCPKLVLLVECKAKDRQ